jgi:hypothetical protein
MTRRMIDRRKAPSETGCTLTIRPRGRGPRRHGHAVARHGHQDTPELLGAAAGRPGRTLHLRWPDRDEAARRNSCSTWPVPRRRPRETSPSNPSPGGSS